MTYTVCLTGGIGSGKSTVARRFEERGVTVIDTDQIAHALTGPGGAAMPVIRREFGDAFVDPHGALDRARMRATVFDDPEARRRLETILHPMIRDESDRLAAAAAGPYVLLVIPLLVESGGPRGRCHRVLVVDCPVVQQIERVARRSGLARREVEAIITAQASREARLAIADDVIDNRVGPEALDDQVKSLHARYLSLAAAAL